MITNVILKIDYEVMFEVFGLPASRYIISFIPAMNLLLI
jgi:hypothetical protein